MRPEQILQKLIRFDTTNPPGNEKPCIQYIAGLLKDAGIKTEYLFKNPKRSNLFARIKGGSKSSPLMLYGHVDVVAAKDQMWTYPPFEGRIENGCVWGRGSLDMKGGIAMFLSAVIKALKDHISFPGDIILCFLCDEEMSSEFGAQYLVEKHSKRFKDVKYAVSEFGGFPLNIAGKRFYPIQVAEKQICRIEAVFKGPPAHGSMYTKNQASFKMAEFIKKIQSGRFPVHITPVTKMMFREIAGSLGFPYNLIFRLLLNPLFTNTILKCLGSNAQNFQPFFRNILNGTILQGGNKINVLPSYISLKMDGRILPGIKPEDFIKEIQTIAGIHIDLKIIDSQPLKDSPDLGIFKTLKSILKQMDPDAYSIPMLLSGSTDARFFSRLGIQTYGFIPMTLPPDIPFLKSIHGLDERIPVTALEFGTEAVYRLLKKF